MLFTPSLRDSRPLLLLDVDGVLNILGAGDGSPTECFGASGHLIRHRTDLPELLARLRARFELVWATAWEQRANTGIAPRLGLPELPVICFSQHPGRALPTWKLPAVISHVGRRAFAWVDDVLGLDAHRWAAARREPTLLLDVDPATGLTPGHVNTLLAFAGALERVEAPTT